MDIIKKAETAKGKVIYTLYSCGGSKGNTSYGISVSSKIFGDEEKASADDITTDLRFAEKLLYLLADNLVLPSTFNEVVEEYLAAAFTV